ncbi:shikimate dehydrogenase [Jiangella sp. DSM 45060]|uniref:shikimate dehydrogenase n=1 Tax=Jiangella sp. DSM 45060 TaxID=1798224 RepID=UPI00087D6A0D|nr:shikimate dehydrogenase [Jiangella sp. DSM 45060]SDT03465.1 shikimate dehydrogenase [Jiangella sp. DSM 45060]
MLTRCAVLGSPIAHSLSPVIHRAAYRHLGLDWEYTAHEVGEGDLAGFVASLGAGWRGLSLTMPLKRVGLDLATSASDVAATVGAANTLVRRDDGGWDADNTDVPGIVATLREAGAAAGSDAGAAAAAAPVCLWGGGATAASVLAALAFLESGPVHVHVRSAARAEAALAVAAALGHPAEPAPWAVLPACAGAGATVTTAPSGALDELAPDLVAAALGATGGAGRVLFDVVYDPWPTPVAAAWQAAGGVVASGLDLLVHQAVGQVHLMTGADVPVDVLRSAALAAIGARA